MKILKQILWVVFSFGLLQISAQTLINNGAELTLSSGSGLYIDGDFENKNNGSIDNSGEIEITGNWTNNANSGNLLQGTIGMVTFNGSSDQIIGGSAKTWFHDVVVQNNLGLDINTNISGELHLSGSTVSLHSYLLLLENTASITGAGSSSYIVADAAGRVIREVGNSTVLFPVGTASSFAPVTIKNNGTVDNYGVRVFADVLASGTSGSTIPQIDHCVNLTWDIIEQSQGGSDLTLTTYWGNSVEGSLFDNTLAGLGHYTGGSWAPQPAQDASGSAPHSITRTGITVLSAFAVGDINSPMAVTLDLSVDLRVFLEGPFSGTSMKSDLNDLNLIPLEQPFSGSPWNYNGNENVVEIPNPYIVDWILVEIRDAASAELADAGTIIGRQAGFVLQDGSIVGTDGFSDMQFEAVVSQNLFAAIFHRNHLGIISANPLPQTDGNYSYNFSTDAFQAYGTGSPQKQLAAGIYGMYGGDINVSGNVGPGDKNSWNILAGFTGYSSADANLDGEIDNRDKNEVLIENAGQGSFVPE